MKSPAGTPEKGKNKGRENLRPPWKKGESGNPKGKPLGTKHVSTVIKELLSANATLDEDFEGKTGRKVSVRELIAYALLKRAAKGSEKAAEIIMDRTEGKVTQKLEHTGADGEPLVIKWADE